MDADAPPYDWEANNDSDMENVQNVEKVVGTDVTVNTPEKRHEANAIGEDFTENPEQEGQTAEPLPAAFIGPALPGNAVPSTTAANSDIPPAPRSAAATVGAPNASNTVAGEHTYGYNYYRSLADFAGTKTTRALSNAHASSEEESLLRKRWLPQFLAANGLSKLIVLLRKLYRVQASIEDAKKQQLVASIRFPDAEAPALGIKINEKILKRCLREVMECVRVLLISQMCAVTQDQDIALSLTRKLSSTAKKRDDVEMADQEGAKQGGQDSPNADAMPEQDDNQIDSSARQRTDEQKDAEKAKGKSSERKKTKLQEEQEHTEQEMKPLIDLIKSRQDLQMDFTAALELESF